MFRLSPRHLSSSKHLCLHILPSICSPKSVVLRVWPWTSSIRGSGNLQEMQIHSHITELCLNKPLGNSDAGARLTNTAWEKPTISYIKGQPFVFPIPSALLKGVALARPPFSPQYIMNLPHFSEIIPISIETCYESSHLTEKNYLTLRQKLMLLSWGRIPSSVENFSFALQAFNWLGEVHPHCWG